MANLSGPLGERLRRWRGRAGRALAGGSTPRFWLVAGAAALSVLIVVDLIRAPAGGARWGIMAEFGLVGLVASGAPRLGGRFSRPIDRIFRGITALAALVMLSLFLVALVVLYDQSLPTIDQFGVGFLTSSSWVPYPPPGVAVAFGGYPAIYGTLVVAGIAMLLGIPLSLGIAVFLTEYSPRWVRSPLSQIVELLAAVPSVVYGLWGFFVLVPYMRDHVDPTLTGTLGTLPGLSAIFGANQVGASGFNFLTAGVILAIMVIPTISAVTRESFLAVPQEQREAALSLGATRWEMTALSVIPAARRGIFGAVILGLGRAIGETVAVLLVIGNVFAVYGSVLAPGTTIAAWIAGEWGEATGLQRNALLELGLILLLISLAINVSARLIVRRRSFAGVV